MSEISFSELVVPVGGSTVHSLAGTVPVIMNLEVFYNSSTQQVDNKAFVTVRLSGYGVQQRILWEGVIEAPQPQEVWIEKIPTSLMTTSYVPFPVPLEAPPQPIPDQYGMEDIHINYYDYYTGEIVHDHLGLAFFPNEQGHHDMMIVNTVINTALMIGARNIIITDPKMP